MCRLKKLLSAKKIIWFGIIVEKLFFATTIKFFQFSEICIWML